MKDRRVQLDRRCRLERHSVSKSHILPILAAAIVVLLIVGHAIKGATKVNAVAVDFVQQQMAPLSPQPMPEMK